MISFTFITNVIAADFQIKNELNVITTVLYIIRIPRFSTFCHPTYWIPIFKGSQLVLLPFTAYRYYFISCFPLMFANVLFHLLLFKLKTRENEFGKFKPNKQHSKRLETIGEGGAFISSSERAHR